MTDPSNIDNPEEERKLDEKSQPSDSETIESPEDKEPISDSGNELESENQNLESNEMRSEDENILSSEEDNTSRFQEFFSETVQSSSPKLTDTLMNYLQLKGIDEELAEIEEEKGDLPENIHSMKSEIRFLDSGLKIKKELLNGLGEEKSKLLSDNSSFEERINKYDEQKFDVRSNKEYDEIIKTIESLFDEVGKNEARVKEIDGQTGALSTDAEALEAKVGELKTELDEKQTLLNELDEQYKQEESVLREKRNALTSKLDPQSLSLYERINGMYKGEATAIVRKGNCSGCYNSIPPQRVIEIKSAERIFTCQSCGRILISEELIHS